MFKWAEKLPDTATPPSPPPPDPRAAMLKWFSYAHLSPEIQGTSAQFSTFANWMFSSIPAGPEATIAMRKLLEAKDAAVRAYIDGLARSQKDPAGKADTAGSSTTTTREETSNAKGS